MVKIFSALSIKELEQQVNNFENNNSHLYYFSEHSISHYNGEYVMSVVLAHKEFI